MFVALLPLILMARSGWREDGAVLELMQIAGILLLVAAVLGRFWAILYIGADKNRRVMDQGPYSICRHPLYFFSTLGAVAFGLMLGSFVLAACLGGAVFAVLSITAAREERFLRATFGDQYDRYAARVPRILPDPRLFTSPDRIEVSVPTLRTNLADALVFLMLFPLAELAGALQEVWGVPGFAIL